ncbi:MAG: protein kinase, partial [Acidobacteria bacterium]|nr:protein kinase [Acidobacteriota bacterium]
MTIPQGTRLGRYEVRAAIGAGGMGEVYLAEDVRLGRTIALKILPEEMALDLQRMSRFTQEARATSALNHPNIITIHEIDQTASLHFIVTEFIDGVTLRERMKAARLDAGEALDITVQVVSALVAAHAAGIVHRDIKPENVMVRRDGLVKVLDFGIAKLTDRMSRKSHARVDAETLLATGEGVIVGTVSYMSPEQARAEEVDERTDLWSVGVMLYEMLAGHRPFEAATPVEALALILHKEPVPLARSAPDVPADLGGIVQKTLAKNRDERYRTAEDLLLDLRRLTREINLEKPLERFLAPDQSSSSRVRGANRSSHADTVIGSDNDGISAGSSELTAAAAEQPHNLSAELTLLIGRERETAELMQMLRREDVRLVTLTGIGGTGKTRLALSVARASLTEFASGIFFIDLSAISETGLVASAVAQPLGVKETGNTPLKESLKEYLREKQVLLVLDNFEQVIDAAPFVAELLFSSPRLKMLVTSRVSLHLSAEHEYIVPPLALPETEHRLP